MLGQNHFYHETIRRCVIAFGSVFNDIQVQRKDATGNIAQSLKVPLAYGPKQKFLARLYENPNLTNTHQITLPRMGFEITGFQYDGARKVNKLNVKRTLSTGNNVKRQYTSVPYNFSFSLFIMAKNQEDALQIVEQVLPFFTPAYTLTINAVPEMNIKDDFPLILEGLSYEDDYEGDFASRRSIIYTMTFTAKVNFYGPISEQGVIKSVRADAFLDNQAITGQSTIPTSRLTTTPDPTTADSDDDYGFSETWTNPNG
jgi:hypothetical protein|tara:strand:+ start:1670 stop:2440 length:771 start_codon:yes stop_codon:yes gene_type:complete